MRNIILEQNVRYRTFYKVGFVVKRWL